MVNQGPDVSSLAEVLDRILDKGIVVDVWARIRNSNNFVRYCINTSL